MQKFWETIWNSESGDGTWEIVVDKDNRTVKLEFWDYTNQGSENENLKKTTELQLSFEQYQSLLEFSHKMNKNVWSGF